MSVRRGRTARPPVSASTACSTRWVLAAVRARGGRCRGGRTWWDSLLRCRRSTITRARTRSTPGRGQRAPTPNPRRRPSPAGVGPHRGTGTAGLRLPARRARQANRALRPAIWTRAPAPGPHATQAPAGFPAGPSVRDGGHFTPHQRRDRGRRLRRDSPDRPIPYLAPAAYTPPPWNVSIS